MTQSWIAPPMSFGTAISTVFRKYAEFGGRATRAEFWWFTLFAALVSRSCAGASRPGPTAPRTSPLQVF